jgi:hypothetical protein
MIDISGIITTVAGIGLQGYSRDEGLAVRAQLYRPYGVSVDQIGRIFIADGDNMLLE